MIGQEVRNYDGTPTKYLPQPDNFLDAFQTGFGTNTNVAVDGGTEKSTFRLSYNHNQGEALSEQINLIKMLLIFGQHTSLLNRLILMQEFLIAILTDKILHGWVDWMLSLHTILVNYLPGYYQEIMIPNTGCKKIITPVFLEAHQN